jgi:Flp pilus assembly protein TadB
MNAAADQLQSERVIVQAPLSFTGSTKRILRLTEPKRAFALRTVASPWWKGTLLVLLDSLIVLAVGLFLLLMWGLDVAWYVIFGILLVPYRLIRRSDRNRKRDALQHREMLDAAVAAQASANQRGLEDKR